MGRERAVRVAAEVQRLVADLAWTVARKPLAGVAGEDQPAVDRELRDALYRVVLAVGEPRGGPGLPVRRHDDEDADEEQRDVREADDLAVHRGSFARFETSRRPASTRKFATMLDPPYETKGSVIPVSGTTRRTPPTMMNVWRAKPKVRPAARSFEKPSSARSAIRIPRA